MKKLLEIFWVQIKITQSKKLNHESLSLSLELSSEDEVSYLNIAPIPYLYIFFGLLSFSMHSPYF